MTLFFFFIYFLQMCVQRFFCVVCVHAGSQLLWDYQNRQSEAVFRDHLETTEWSVRLAGTCWLDSGREERAENWRCGWHILMVNANIEWTNQLYLCLGAQIWHSVFYLSTFTLSCMSNVDIRCTHNRHDKYVLIDETFVFMFFLST